MTVLLGTSGWRYKDWRERFYPPDIPQRAWLEYYARHFATVESNNAFYRLPEGERFATWAASTPDDFVMAVKMSRYLTHIKRLREPEEPVARFLDRVRHLGDKLGPVLLQLPPTLRADLDLLETTLSRFPAGLRVAVEFRHDSWWTPETRAVLERNDAALCLADRDSKPIAPLWQTTDWTYLPAACGSSFTLPLLRSRGARVVGGAIGRAFQGFRCVCLLQQRSRWVRAPRRALVRTGVNEARSRDHAHARPADSARVVFAHG